MKRSSVYTGCFLFLLLLGCRNEKTDDVGRSWYFWKTVFTLNEGEQDDLIKSHISRLYIRMFDVVWDTSRKEPRPVADIRFLKPVSEKLDPVPVVFIRNEVFLQVRKEEIPRFADSLVSRMLKGIRGRSLKEAQVDCDWNLTTRDNYFQFLSRAKADLYRQHVLLSATIRLHQVKYYRKTGVPPVDKGILMFYNMGNLEDEETRNSVYDEQTAATYLYNFSAYPLELDVALACYHQASVFEHGRIRNLVKIQNDSVFADTSLFKKTGPGRYHVLKEGQIQGIPVLAGEHIRVDGTGPEECLQSARQIAPFLKKNNIHVAIFQLDKANPSAYEKEIIETVYHCFR